MAETVGIIKDVLMIIVTALGIWKIWLDIAEKKKKRPDKDAN